eukprot:GHVR01102922.1.p1 GENE.GHVR01102922.1~~GHVR01102922.1.p1  ORF type:complete len:107 (+),score=2.50 GHVR01102922.1:781-1101(+)
MLEGKHKLRMKKSIRIHIDKVNSWLSVGIAYKSFAEKANYYFNTGSLNHGGYLVSNNGYSWHHTDLSKNSFYCQWTFKQGDTILITVDPKNKIINFVKEESNTEPY